MCKPPLQGFILQNVLPVVKKYAAPVANVGNSCIGLEGCLWWRFGLLLAQEAYENKYGTENSRIPKIFLVDAQHQDSYEKPKGESCWLDDIV